MSRKKPWNLVSLPVYSISSKNADGNTNMNIITYANAVSMQPKQFVCAIYHNTQTLFNVQLNAHFVLQILAEQQYRLIDLLGKKSGKQINKAERLHKRNLLMEWKGFEVLKDCVAVMEMKVQPLQIQAGQALPDHQLYLCDVISYKNLNESKPLTLDILRNKKLIRI
ncbi:MAG: hypothetical protein C0459_02940 [Chitinophaga sp.]|jgi:flavin reductase (DIM6/NTAB) family NADH-FMN oxidoreductase RutF|nr:hypothetical protein [Chitinophaga sp.]